MTLSQLIEILGGELVQGSPEIVIAAVDSPSSAKGLDLIFAEDAAAARVALASEASAIVTKQGCLALPTEHPLKGVIETGQPRLWFSRAAKLLEGKPPSHGIHLTAVIGSHVEIAEDVFIGPCAVIESGVRIGAGSRIEAGVVVGHGVSIGQECHLYPRAVLYPGTTLGDRVKVHAGAVLGADGFGYVRDYATGAYTQFPQQGTLVLEDDVEIGANSTVDRGALKETRIGRGTKIDNLVHVGHNCQIGEDVILVSLTGISGSSSVGKGAVLAGQVGIGDHAHVGPGVILGGQAGVLSGKTVTNQGLRPGSVLWGTPARPLMQVLREIAIVGAMAKAPRKGRKPPADTDQPRSDS